MPAGLAIVLSLAFCGLFVALAILFGPRRASAEKMAPFECGSEPIGTPRGRYSVKFYRVAILFLVFDLEVAFIYPWAVNYFDLSTTAAGAVSFYGFGLMTVFLIPLVVGLAYDWKAIGWD
jgi:NADH-quinone oxidoreductase subunit A